MSGLADRVPNDEIRRTMALASARKLLPWFVQAFFSTALRSYGGRITGRENGRFEITRVPAAVRAAADQSLGTVHDRYAQGDFRQGPHRAGSASF